MSDVETTLLLIEDNDSNRRMIKRRLERRDFSVSTSPSAESIFKTLETSTPDAVLMDISLPGMNGLEATRKIRKQPEYQNLPILALTAHVRDKDREEALEAGCDAFTTKPVDVDNLINRIEEILD